MYRIEVQSASSNPFSGLDEAQESHIALAQAVDLLNAALAAPNKDLGQIAARCAEPGSRDEVIRSALDTLDEIARLRRQIRAFEWRLAATGAVIADLQQRSLAQSLLDYWALRQVELRDSAWRFRQVIVDQKRPEPHHPKLSDLFPPRPATRRPVSPRMLLPVDESLAEDLATKAERTYAELADDTQRGKARELFLSIAAPFSRSWDVDSSVAARFAGAGVIVASGGTGALRYSLAHDSLARQWPRMVAWMKESRDEEIQFERVLANARNWKAVKYGDLLPQGEALVQAQRFTERDPIIAEFVAAAKQAADHDAQRRKRFRGCIWFLGIFGLLVIVALGLLGRNTMNKQSATSVTQDVGATESAVETEAANDVVALSTEPAATRTCQAAQDAEGFLWIGSLGNSQVFDGNGKPIEPDRVERDMALYLRAWFNLRARKPDNDGKNIAGEVSGTASARSQAIALGRPETVPVRDTAQYWVRVRLPSSVYIQVPAKAAGDLDGLVARLEQTKLQVPAVQRLDMPPGLNEVRYYYDQDAKRAAQVACLANLGLSETDPNRVELRSLANTSLAAKVSNGTIELWLFPKSERPAQPSPRDPLSLSRPRPHGGSGEAVR